MPEGQVIVEELVDHGDDEISEVSDTSRDEIL
jgi:hypothetical protein